MRWSMLSNDERFLRRLTRIRWSVIRDGEDGASASLAMG
jgi:hypothetical protein